jgi:winged helix DNA-binding protein
VAERTLTQRELNRALLARQLLLERVRMPIARALERIAGIQDQYAPNAYIRLWSCLDGFQRDDLTRAFERRSVIQATLMRGTIHVVSKRDYWPFAVAIRAAQREWLVRAWKVTEPELERQADQLRLLLAEGPRRAEELKAAGRTWDPALALVRVPPSGTWERRRANLVELAERWVGPENARVDEAVVHLVKRYLAGFGPAARDDIASWAGLKRAHVDAVLERLELRRFRDEARGELLDLPRAPLPDPETPAPVRFLPTWDAVLLVHARRTGVLPEAYRARIFSTKAPQSVGTFLVDGEVAGTWRFDRGRIAWKAFGRLDATSRREVAAEAEQLAVLHR